MPLNDPAYYVDLLDHIVSLGCACLEDTVTGVPADCFVSHCVPADDCCDFLAVWIDEIYPTRNFPVPYEGTSRECTDVSPAIRVGLRLMRPCVPTLVDNATNPFPAASELDASAKDLLVDARVLWCCLIQAHAQGDLWPEGYECLDVKWGSMEPECPRGGCAGWTWFFDLETDQCC